MNMYSCLSGLAYTTNKTVAFMLYYLRSLMQVPLSQGAACQGKERVGG